MKKYMILSLVVLSLLLGVYTNCSEVDFATTENGTLTSVSGGASGDSSGGGSGESTGDGSFESDPGVSDEELISALPPEERDIFRPISDIIDDPSLIDVFACPGGDGILICHFPSNADSVHTICVGGKAPESHMAHEAQISPDGQLLTLSDYLGPCRH